MLHKPGVMSRYIYRCCIKRLMHASPTERALMLTDLEADAQNNKYWLDDLAQYRLNHHYPHLPAPEWLHAERCARDHNHTQAQLYFNTANIQILEMWHGLVIRATNLSERTKEMGVNGKSVVLEKECLDTELGYAVGQYIAKLKQIAAEVDLTPGDIVKFVAREVKGLDAMIVGNTVVLKANAGICFTLNNKAAKEELVEA